MYGWIIEADAVRPIRETLNATSDYDRERLRELLLRKLTLLEANNFGLAIAMLDTATRRYTF